MGFPAVLGGSPSLFTCASIIVLARAAHCKQMHEDMLKKEQRKILALLPEENWEEIGEENFMSQQK